MSATVMPLEGLAWQRWANELLVEHYGPTTYIKIPDTQGDGGIEGFTCPCGIAYQAYGAEKEKSGKALYEAQRNKMTRDINKFIANAPLLTKLFGDVRHPANKNVPANPQIPELPPLVDQQTCVGAHL